MGKPTDFFDEQAAKRYDERNRKLASITENLHFLTGLVLKDLPSRARILCVGAGTGAEILALAPTNPEWTFVALDPSSAMLDVCRERVRAAGLSERCEFIHGYVQDAPRGTEYDAVLSVLVAHFIPRADRPTFFREISDRLRAGGSLVDVEISFDMEAVEFPSMLEHWKSVQSLMGATPESLASLPKQLKDVLTILPPAETERLIRESGFPVPVRFFQALMISGWYARKSV